MKLSLYLSIIALAANAMLPQAASAQEARGARFNFAPNVWKAENSRVPKGYGEFREPPHTVHAGAVPTSDALGLDPSMLQKPAPPPVVAAAPATTTVTPTMFVPKTNFNPLFGRPQEAKPIAHLPVTMPQQAVAKPLTAPVTPVAAKPAPAAHKHVNIALSGKMLTPKHRVVSPDSASPAVASYGKNFGYVPGPFLPSSGGMNSSAEVHGTLMTHVTHRHK